MNLKDYYFKKFKNKAAGYFHDHARLRWLLEQAKAKLERGSTELTDALDGIKLFIRLLKAYLDGKYRDIPAERIILIVAAFIYLVSPIDAVFDFLPGGLLDDAAIFLWLINSLKSEIEKFKEWEKKNAGVL